MRRLIALVITAAALVALPALALAFEGRSEAPGAEGHPHYPTRPGYPTICLTIPPYPTYPDRPGEHHGEFHHWCPEPPEPSPEPPSPEPPSPEPPSESESPTPPAPEPPSPPGETTPEPEPEPEPVAPPAPGSPAAASSSSGGE